MGQPVTPQPRHAELWCAVLGRHAGNRVDVDGGWSSALERDGWIGRHALLDPQLVDVRAPRREQADAVPGAGDLVEPSCQLFPRQPFVHTLGDLVLRFDIQPNAHDDTERTQPDDRTLEVAVTTFQVRDRAVGAKDVDGAHRDGKVPDAVARAVRSRGDRAADGDVREGGKVVQREPVFVQHRRKPAVRHRRVHLDGRAGGVDDHLVGESLEADQVLGVGDLVERVPASQDVDARRSHHDFVQFVHRRRPLDACRAVFDVASPVALSHAAILALRSDAGFGGMFRA